MDQEEISGIDELRQRYLDDIVVELRPLLRDGKPAAFMCRQLRPIAFMAMGKGIPIPTAKTNGDGSSEHEEVDEAERAKYEYMKKVVARSMVAVREVYRKPGTDWQERWTPVDVVYDARPTAGQRHIEDFDFMDNIVRCFNAIFANIMEGGRLEGTAAARFRPAGHGDGMPDGKALGQVAARDRVRGKRRARV